MERLRSRKRHRTDGPSPHENSLTKGVKEQLTDDSPLHIDYLKEPKHRLSQIPLVRSAVEELDRSVRNELTKSIIPSTIQDKPMAPNSFLEIKGPNGSTAVAGRQARYDGALGARAMHALQNYSKDELEYDGNAYAFSSTYHDGQLKLFTHHITAPSALDSQPECRWPECRRPEYHMTQLGAWSVTNDIDDFRHGATAFRNARDLAKQYRDRFIQSANTRASQARTAAARADTTELKKYKIPTHHEHMDPAHHITLQKANSEPQHIADASPYDLEDADEAPIAPRYPRTEDNSQGPSPEASQEPVALGDDPSMSIVSSFTSGFGGSKRSRQPLSLPSQSSGNRGRKLGRGRLQPYEL